MLIVPLFERLNKLQPWTKMGVEVFVLNLGVGRHFAARAVLPRDVRRCCHGAGQGRDLPVCVGRSGAALNSARHSRHMGCSVECAVGVCAVTSTVGVVLGRVAVTVRVGGAAGACGDAQLHG